MPAAEHCIIITTEVVVIRVCRDLFVHRIKTQILLGEIVALALTSEFTEGKRTKLNEKAGKF